MDQVCEGDKTRLLEINREYIPVDPPKQNKKFPWEYNKELYQRRNTVEHWDSSVFAKFSLAIIS